MRALVYHGPGVKAWQEVPKPELIDETDAIVRVDTTTICGSDLHILKGDLPEVTDGRILGHEAVGTVEEVGASVKNMRPGDRVLVSCITACGRCQYCREARYGQCLGGGGWILGHLIDGTQAEYVRVPFADNSTYAVPAGVSDDDVLMLADIVPTGYEVGVLNGHVQPGDLVTVVGAGPVGLSAIMGARLFSPRLVVAIDLVDSRLEAAKRFGADVVVNNSRQDPLEVVRELSAGLGADVAIEAVGTPNTFELATTLIRPCGHVANIGVHGKPVTLHTSPPPGPATCSSSSASSSPPSSAKPPTSIAGASAPCSRISPVGDHTAGMVLRASAASDWQDGRSATVADEMPARKFCDRHVHAASETVRVSEIAWRRSTSPPSRHASCATRNRHRQLGALGHRVVRRRDAQRRIERRSIVLVGLLKQPGHSAEQLVLRERSEQVRSEQVLARNGGGAG